MKKFKQLVAVALLAVGFSFGAGAQTYFGGGVAYGSDIEEAGVNLRLGGMVSENVLIGLDYNYFFPGRDGASDLDVMGFNLNASYHLNLGEVLYIYPLGGVNATYIRTEVLGVKSDSWEVGGNAGAGLGLHFGAITPFVEGKYVFSSYDQSVFNVGVVFAIE